MREMKIWDMPVRLFHWLLAGLFLLSWGSAEFDFFTVHYYSGYGIFTLLLFRIVWGFFGSDTARLLGLVASPKAVIGYVPELLRRSPGNDVGHNPIGGLAVLALLALLCAQVATGLFAQDIDFINAGPLSDLISFDAGVAASDWHHWLFDILLILVAIHLFAVAFHELYKGERLILTMLTGWRRFGADGPIQPPTLMPVGRAFLILAVVVALVVFAVWGLPKIL